MYRLHIANTEQSRKPLVLDQLLLACMSASLFSFFLFSSKCVTDRSHTSLQGHYPGLTALSSTSWTNTINYWKYLLWRVCSCALAVWTCPVCSGQTSSRTESKSHSVPSKNAQTSKSSAHCFPAPPCLVHLSFSCLSFYLCKSQIYTQIYARPFHTWHVLWMRSYTLVRLHW